MLTDKDRAQLLRDAVEMLQEADRLQQLALGDSDVCEDNHNSLQLLIEDFELDVIEFEGQALG
jgi:hypothetical protein